MIPLFRWEIIVESGGHFPSLADYFRSPDLRLSWTHDNHTGHQFSAYSAHLDALDDPRLLVKRAYSLGLLFNGAWRLTEPTKWQFLTSFRSCYQDGVMLEVTCDSIEAYPFSREIALDPVSVPEKFCIEKIISLAKSHDDFRHLVFLVGLIALGTSIEKIHTWSTLYKISEAVELGIKEANKRLTDFVDTTQLRKFKAAVNNMTVLGLNARHGPSSNPPPPQESVLTDIGEAIALILGMASRYSKWYALNSTV